VLRVDSENGIPRPGDFESVFCNIAPTFILMHSEAEPLSFVTVAANYDMHAGAKALHRIPEQSITTCIPEKLTIATQMVRVYRQTGLLRIPPAL
jgi:hypothetical protein